MIQPVNPWPAPWYVAFSNLVDSGRTLSVTGLVVLDLGNSRNGVLLDEFFVHPYIRGIAHAEGFLELDKGRAALQQPYSEGVA